ncbi:MAG: 50S ribosomal protein L18 [Candidatus Omnitrophota bacterium]|nr:MAG: 50S ribosomal protein L18 [Candidatus Omnitrophota bacterium]
MKNIGRQRRHKRITKKLRGSKERPRLVVFRSRKHMYAQLINDSNQRVVTASSTLDKEFVTKKAKSTNKEAAAAIGKLVAQKALKLKIKEVSFDRAGYKYHGRVKAFADGAREAGLKF